MVERRMRNGFRKDHKESVELRLPKRFGGGTRIQNILYPYNDAERARPHTREREQGCPYNTVRLSLECVIPAAMAEKEVARGDAVFCWQYCTLEACPTYQANNHKKIDEKIH